MKKVSAKWLPADWWTWHDDGFHGKFAQRRFAAAGALAAKDLGTAVGLVEVPEGAGKLVFMLGVAGQISDEDQAAFRDCLLLKQAEL